MGISNDMQKAGDEAPGPEQVRQPEALANFAATARSADKVSPTSGRQGSPETIAVPTDPQAKADAATKRLREGTLHADQGAEEAIEKLPDRTHSTSR
jgi:hypothetical protein